MTVASRSVDRANKGRMMQILIAVASKHGSTDEIANAIGTELSTLGLDVSVVPVQDVDTIKGYDAVVLGSAIHMGRWMKPAKDFVFPRGSDTRVDSPVVVLKRTSDGPSKTG